MKPGKSCPNLEFNISKCGCTYSTCDKRGKCCECVRYHKERNELPGCLFPPEVEKTFDRSVRRFVATDR